MPDNATNVIMSLYTCSVSLMSSNFAIVHSPIELFNRTRFNSCSKIIIILLIILNNFNNNIIIIIIIMIIIIIIEYY